MVMMMMMMSVSQPHAATAPLADTSVWVVVSGTFWAMLAGTWRLDFG